MSSHDARIDEVLIRALAGDEDIEVVLKREGLDSDPRCAERLREIRALCGDLDDMARIEKLDVPELAEEAHPAEPERERPLPFARVIAAAALLLALISFSVWQFGQGTLVDPDGDGSGGQTIMGTRAIRNLESDGFTSFRWQSSLAPTTKFEVRVFHPDGSEPIDVSDRIHSSRWTPSPERSDTWPEEIRWEVHVVRTGSNESEHSASSFASRSS